MAFDFTRNRLQPCNNRAAIMKRKFYEGQIVNNKVVKTVWSDSSNYMIKFTDGSFEVIKK